MKAAYVEELGGTDRIRYGELADPRPGPGEVLVQTEAVAANHVDTLIRSGRYSTPLPFPFILGRDVVGTVAGVGAGVDVYRPGDRVWCNSLGHDGRQGSFAELAVVATDRCYPLPDGVAPADAVAVFHPAATAYLALQVHGRLRPGETVLVHGGNGAVGRCLIRIARMNGARVIATVRGRARQRNVGDAEITIDTSSRPIDDALREMAPDGVDVACDTTGAVPIAEDLSRLGIGGRVVVIAAQERFETFPRRFYTRDATVTGFVISRASVVDLARAADVVNRLLVDPDPLRLPVAWRARLSEAAEAHRRLEDARAGRSRLGGRIVLTP